MSKSRSIAWCIWLIASIFYAYQFILRVMPNIMLNDIMKHFDIDAAVFGQFSGAYYIGYCAMHLPIGIMLDRYGPKKVMSASIALTVIGLLPIIMSTHPIYPIIGRLLIGMGSSAAILGTFKIIRMTFPEKHFTRMLSLSVTIGLVGAIYGGGPVSYLCDTYGYQKVIEIFAWLGLAFACVTYLLVPDIDSTNTSSVTSNIKTVFLNRKVMFVCFLAGLMVGPMEGFADAWGSAFLKQVYNFDTPTANYLTSMIYIGMCFAPLLSQVAEKTGHYLGTIAGSGVIMFMVFTMLCYGSLGKNTIMIGLFIAGICSAYQILAIYQASTYVTENVAGLTTGVANMVIMSFGYIFHSCIGLIVQYYSSMGEATSLIYGVSIIPMTLLIGSIGFFILAYNDKKSNTI